MDKSYKIGTWLGKASTSSENYAYPRLRSCCNWAVKLRKAQSVNKISHKYSADPNQNLEQVLINTSEFLVLVLSRSCKWKRQ